MMRATIPTARALTAAHLRCPDLRIGPPRELDKQWINVAGLRGCFAFRDAGRPANLLYESDEDNNSSRRLVHLPFHGDTGC
jgi:hypothetical protein